MRGKKSVQREKVRGDSSEGKVISSKGKVIPSVERGNSLTDNEEIPSAGNKEPP